MTRRGRKRVALVLTAGAAMILLAIGGSKLQQFRKDRLLTSKLQEGMAAYQARDYEGAIADLGYYVASKGDNADALFALADSRRRVPAENDRHIGRAIEMARRALQIAPDKKPVLEMLMELYGIVGFMTERLDAADRLLVLDPASTVAMSARVESLIVLGRRNEALEAAESMAAAKPDDLDAHRTVVVLMEMLDRPREEILAYVTDLAAQHPTSLRAASLLIAVTFRFGDADEAISLARRSAPLPAESVAAVSEFLRVLDSLGMDDEAAAFLTREIQGGRFGPEISIVAAERAWKAGRAVDARQFIDPALASADEEALGWSAFLEAAGHGAPTPGASLRALAKSTTPAGAFWREIVAGEEQMRAADPAAAREHLRSALATRPTSTLAEFLLARVHESVGDWVTAVARWELVVDRDPSYRVARFALVSTLLRNGRIDDARRHAVHALAARSGLVEVYGVSRAFVAAIEAGQAPSGDFDRIIGSLEGLRGRPGADAVVLPMLARAYAAVGRTDEANAVTRAILDGDVRLSTEDTVGLARALRRSSPELASSLVQSALAAAPSDFDLIFIAAMNAAQDGRAPEGRAMLEAAAARSEGPARTTADLHLAVFLDRTGDPSAAEVFAGLAAANPRDARVQIAFLESQSAWADQGNVAAAIGRLRAVAGESAPVWKLHESRRLLLFDRTPAQAAKVVQLLADLLRIDPDSPAGMTLMADAMLLLEDRAKAIDYLGRVLDTNPTPALYPTLIGLLHESGRTDDVQRRLREFLALKQVTTELRRTRAQLLASQGMLTEAMAEYEALAADGNPADLLGLARICVRRGDTQRAADIFDRLLAAPDPGVPTVLAAAQFAALRGDIDGGIAILDHLPSTLAPHERAIHIGAFLDRHGRESEAERSYMQATAAATPEAWSALIGFYITHGRHDEADAAVTQALAADPESADLLRLQGLAKLARGESLPAGTMADVASLVLTEGSPQTRDRLLEVMRFGETNPADRAGLVSRLRRITETDPVFYPAWFFLISTLVEQGSFQDAAQSARAAVRFMPTDARIARLAVAALSRGGDAEGALAMAREWRTRVVGSTIEPDVTIAFLCNRLGRPADGLAALEPWQDRLITEAARHTERLELYAKLLVAVGRHDEAHRVLWPLAQGEPRFARVYLRVAEQIDRAPQTRLEWITRVEPLVINEPGARYELAQAWYTSAIEDKDTAGLRRAIELIGDDPLATAEPAKAAMLLAVSHEAIGNIDAALRFYRLAVEGSPNDPTALNNFAYLLVTSGGSAAEALPLAERAVQLAGQAGLPPIFRASFLDTLGVVLLRLDRFDDAERTFRDAMVLNPRDIGLLVGAAEAQAGRGDASAAVTLDRIDAMIAAGSAVNPQIGARLQAVRSRLQQGAANPG